MNKKILAVDMDGTLFDDTKEICKSNIDALIAMLDAGHVLAIDTGRPIFVLKQLLKRFGIFERENVYLLGYQGSAGVNNHDGKEIYADCLEQDVAMKLLKYGFESGHSVVAFDKDAIYSFRDDDNVKRYAALAQEPVDIIDSPEFLKNHDLMKIMIIDFDNPDSLFDFEAAHKEELSSDLISMFSQIEFLEYVGKNSSKGQGLIHLANHLGISMENTVACGDERNDISMIKAAGVGVCVANGREELKAVADYVTEKDNNQGAVAEAIYKFILN